MIDDSELQVMLTKARNRNQSMTKLEHQSGFAALQQSPLDTHLRTVVDALICGVKLKDWGPVCEGIVLLQDAIARIPAADHAKQTS